MARDVSPGLSQQVAGSAVILAQQGGQQMQRLDELMITTDRHALFRGEGHLKFRGQFVHPHGLVLCTERVKAQSRRLFFHALFSQHGPSEDLIYIHFCSLCGD
ncbi:MAG: hypothetical protein ACI9DC_002837 [Gammaproteobacteria bacterium]|jgi:hypothetical protein